MSAKQRRTKILQLIREEGSVKVMELSKLFSISEVTIRHDLEKLDNEGLITREHGGAFFKKIDANLQAFPFLNQNNLSKKQLIGKKAADLIETGDVIILDSGSTTTEIAKNLIGRKGITVITNALNIAMMLGSELGIDVIVTGGEFKPLTLSLSGEKAASFFENIHANKLFLATAGFSLKTGLTYPNISDIVVKKAMMAAAETIYLVADSTKIGKKAFASLGTLSLIDYIITDSEINNNEVELLQQNKIKFLIAE